MRKSYPSDITREQYEIVRQDIESFRKATHPRDYDLYDILCAILLFAAAVKKERGFTEWSFPRN